MVSTGAVTAAAASSVVPKMPDLTRRPAVSTEQIGPTEPIARRPKASCTCKRTVGNGGKSRVNGDKMGKSRVNGDKMEVNGGLTEGKWR
jgi:hypothetical protein